MSKEDRYRENIAWLSTLMDTYPHVAWTTRELPFEFPNIMRSLCDGEWYTAQVSDSIVVCLCRTGGQLETFCLSHGGHKGWPIEIQRMAPPPQKKVDYSQITREIVGDLR